MKIKISNEKRRSLCGYVFLAPWLIGFCVFMLVPLILSFLLSIGKITELKDLQIQIIGFQNYKQIFVDDINFVPSFISTIETTILWSPFVLVFAFFIAILLNQNIKGRSVFRVIYFLPVLLGSGFVLQKIGGAGNVLEYSKDVGRLITYYFSEDIATFISSLISQIINTFWKTGVQIVIFLAGLQSIPPSYYEAAKVDNASSWYILWKITIPLMSPILMLNAVYTLIDSFRDMDNKIAELVINVVFKNAEYEYGSAMGWTYFAVVFVIVCLIMLLFRKAVNYDK